METIKNKEEKRSSVPVGQVGIRAELNNMGFSDDKIGYNDKTGAVTLNGIDFMKPSYLDQNAGRSYASRADIQKNLVDFYKNSNNPIVRVSDAYAAKAGSLGLSADSLGYGNGTVMIGGKPLKTLYVDDYGKAWAYQDDVDRLTSELAETVGIESPNSIMREYDNKYLSDIKDKLNDIANRKEFSYNPDTDPVYEAYKRKYLTEAERASANAIADYSALTGGYVNSAAMTAGAQANQYYAGKLSDVIPQLAADAYERYMDKYNADLDYVEHMIDLYDTAYGNALEANNQIMKNTNISSASVTERDNNSFERSQSEKEAEWNELFNRQTYDASERESFWNEIFNTQKRSSNNLENNGQILDNKQKEIYLEYYRRLLDAELSESSADTSKKIAERRDKYGY